MRIKRFTEARDNVLDISSEKINEINDSLYNFVVNLNKEKQTLEKIHSELSNFKSKSKNKNDQIDDSVANLELVKSKLNDTLELLDDISNKLKDYNENGRKYLY